MTMESDAGLVRLNDSLGLVERLRDPSQATCWGTADNLMTEAADEIERLREALAALLPFAPGMYITDPRSDDEIDAAITEAFEMAAKVLGPNRRGNDG